MNRSSRGWVGGLLLLLVWLVAIGTLQWRQWRAAEQAGSRGDLHAVWIFHQLGIERYQMEAMVQDHVQSPDKVRLEDVQLRYEVLLSRLDDLKQGVPSRLIAHAPVYRQLIEAQARFELDGQRLFASGAGGSGLVAALPPFRQRLDELGPLIQDAIVLANQAASERADLRHSELRRTTRLVGLSTVSLALLAIALALTTWYGSRRREVASRQTQRTQDRLVGALQQSEKLLTARLAESKGLLDAAHLALNQNEVALRAARDQADQASRIKSDFLAHMSHELRTPLNAVMGMSHLLLTTDVSNRQRDYIEKIQRSGGDLLGFINEILAFRDMDAGQFAIENIEFDVEQLLDDVATQVRETCPAKDLELVIDIAADLPRQQRGDALRIAQVLIQYAHHAIRSTDAGGVRLMARTEAGAKGAPMLWLGVQGSGMGSSLEQQADGVEPLSQPDASPAGARTGTSVGLALSQELVQLMGGTCGVTRAPGHGSTFWMALPLREHEPSGEMKSSPIDGQEGPAHRLSGARALVVDDNELNQEVASTLLMQMGLCVDRACDGQQALQTLAQRHYDLVLMDMQMPVMDGLEATRQIRQQPEWRELPIMAMTANTLTVDKERCLAAGMNDHITKPLDPVMLRQQVLLLFADRA